MPKSQRKAGGRGRVRRKENTEVEFSEEYRYYLHSRDPKFAYQFLGIRCIGGMGHLTSRTSCRDKVVADGLCLSKMVILQLS